MKKINLYGIQAIYLFVISGLCYFIYRLSSIAGYLTINGANNISNVYGTDRESTEQVFDLFFQYQTEFFNTYFQFTIGHFNNLFGALGILFFVLALVFTIKQFYKK